MVEKLQKEETSPECAEGVPVSTRNGLFPQILKKLAKIISISGSYNLCTLTQDHWSRQQNKILSNYNMFMCYNAKIIACSSAYLTSNPWKMHLKPYSSWKWRRVALLQSKTTMTISTNKLVLITNPYMFWASLIEIIP